MRMISRSKTKLVCLFSGAVTDDEGCVVSENQKCTLGCDYGDRLFLDDCHIADYKT